MNEANEVRASDGSSIIPTEMIERVMARTTSAHKTPGIQVVVGGAGLGKSTALMKVAAEINGASSPFHYAARYFEVAGAKARGSMHRGLQHVHEVFYGPTPDRTFLSRPAERLAADVVMAARKLNVQLLCVDEAGTLSPEGLRGMALIHNIASASGWPMSLVFVGMDDLVRSIESLPQLKSRVMAWTVFEPYAVEQMWRFLAAKSPYFRGLAHERKADWEKVEFVRDRYQGNLRDVLPFLRDLDQYMELLDIAHPDLEFLKDVATNLSEDHLRARENERRRSRGRGSRKSHGADGAQAGAA